MQKNSKFSRLLHFPLTKIIIGLLSVALVTSVVQLGAQAIMKTTGLHEDFQGLIGAVFTAAAALASYIYIFKFYEKRKIEELSLKYFWRNSIAGSLTGFLILTFVILVMYLGKGYTILAINPVLFLLPALALGIVSGIFEEILFRGIIFRITEERLGSVWALVISSSFFGIAHLANQNATVFSAIAITIEAGLLLGSAYIYSRNLWLPIFIHFAWNFSEGGIYGAIISGGGMKKSLISAKFSGSDLLTGGAFGPENSLQAVILGLIAALVFLWLARKQGKIIKPYWRRPSFTASETSVQLPDSSYNIDA